VAALDIAVIGGGIVGASAAALVAEAGPSVALYERDELAAAASGRNSGVIQHPFDPELAPFLRQSVALYERLAAEDAGFELPRREPGLLLVGQERAGVEEVAAMLRATAPELAPELIEPDELARREPALAPGLTACRLATGTPVPPASATRAFGELARRRGAAVVTGTEARVWIEDGSARGVVAGGERIGAGAVLVAAGPWTAELIVAGPELTKPVWGVNVEVELAEPPSLPVEQIGVIGPQPGSADELTSTFSLVTAAGTSSLGSTFLEEEPDADAIAPVLVERGAAFVPALADAPILSTRACARPASPDGRPVVGAVPGVDGLFVAAGHGMWGISIGPATARLVTDLMLARANSIPAPIAAARLLPG
jgi:glycine/D-amino acid oxidase-like deaminating enzyme